MLEARGIVKRFGALVVLDGVDLNIDEGSAVGIIGPNGAGKTTMLDVLAGALRPEGGRVLLRDTDITRRDAARRAGAGIGRTHQVPRPFVGMTVFENALVAAMSARRIGRQQAITQALDSLDTTGLAHRSNDKAQTLGLLDRKRLELARALATRPDILLLDEIAGGLTEAETDQLVETIAGLHADGTTIVWIEHIVHALTRVARRLVCMAGGGIIADGDASAVMKDERVLTAYLGGTDPDART